VRGEKSLGDAKGSVASLEERIANSGINVLAVMMVYWVTCISR
jgi:hypothetical protein